MILIEHAELRSVALHVFTAAGSDAEVEIRAATVQAVERLRACLSARGENVRSVQIDWALWDAAQAAPADGKPYHRTRTIYY